MFEEFKAYDKILNPVVIADESGKIIYINKGVEKLFGYRAYEVLSNDITFLMMDEDAAKHGEHINKYLTTGVRNMIGRDREVFARKKDKTPIHINIFLNELIKDDTRYFIAEVTDLSKQREAEKKLEQVSEDWQAIFNSLPQPAALSSLEGTMLYVSDAFIEKSGVQRDEIIGKNITELGMWNDNDRDIAIKELKTHGFINKEFQFRIKTGTLYGLYSAKIVNFNGSKAILASISDITVIKEAEKSIRKAQENFKTLFNNNPNPLVIQNAKWKILFANKAFCELTGYTEEEMSGKSAGDLKLWVKPEQRQEMLDKFKTDGEVFNQEYQFRTKSGKIYDTLFSTTQIELNGEICYFTSAIDNTEKKLAQESVKQAKDNLESILNLNPSTTIITKISNGEFIYVNKSFIENMGYAREEVLGKTVLELNLWVDIDERQKLFEEIKKNGFVRDKEYRFRTKSGQIITMLYASQVIELNGEKCLIAVGVDISEKKAAEDTIRQSSKSFQTFFNLNPEPTVITDAQTGKYVYVNEAFAKVSGYSQEFLIGKTVADIDGWVRIEDRDEMMTELQQTGLVINKLVRLRKNGGDILDTLISAQLLEINNKKQILFITRNITEQLKTEAALKQSNDRFQKFFDLNPEPCIITNINTGGKVVYANEAFCNDVGFSKEELIGKTTTELNLWADEKEQEGIITELKQKGMIQNKEMRFRHKNGNIEYTLYSGQVINVGDEKHIVSIVRNIHDRKLAEEKIAESNERFQKFFYLNPEPCTITTLDGHYVYVNKAGFELSGYSSSDIKKVSAYQLWNQQTERDHVIDELKTKGFVLNKEVQFKMKAGDIKNLLYSGQIIDIDGKPHVLSITIDITEKKKLEEELLKEKQAADEANKAKSEFLANMSHEIRTPLNAIIGTADLLAETKLDKEQKHYIDIFQRSGEQLLNLISDILDLSKIESGHMELESTSFCMCEVISKACDMIALKAHTKGLELVYDIASDVPEHFIGDKTRLAQVIINLAGNALKFTEKGEISIIVKKLSSSKNSTELLFSVKDSGIGIPEDKLKHIFESFAQVDASVTRKYGGTGLGLAISQRICEMMGGRIWVESELGKGSSFNFTVKLNNDHTTPVNTLNLNKTKIAVIENNKYIADVVHRYVASWGAESSVFSDIASLKKSRDTFDIMLADFSICKEKENCAILKDKTVSNDNIVMLLNSHNIQDDLETLKRISISKYIIKPVKKNDLRETIRKLSEHSSETDVQTQIKAKNKSPNDGQMVQKSILLVDDSDDNRMLVELYLKKTSYKIDTAVNGNEAVEKVQANRYDVVLMDVQMPVLDGYAATRIIREWEKKKKHKPLPIIALTANAFKEDEKKSLEAGCSGHLVKPIRKELLLKTLSGIFDIKA